MKNKFDWAGFFVCMGLIGAGFIIYSLKDYWHGLGAWAYLIEGFAGSLIIAGIIGFSFDRFLKHAITKDVFEAALGYLLPPELKEEMRWLYGNKIMCKEHHQIIDIERIDDAFIRMRVKYDRTFRNVGSSSEDLKLSLGVDEWFHKTEKSKILRFGFIKDGKRTERCGKELITERIDDHLRVNQEDIFNKIKIEPGEEITHWGEYEEIKPVNGDHIFSFLYSTQNPRVTVQINENEFSYRAGFASRKKMEAEKIGNNVWRFVGLMLPHQHIRVRWWEKNTTN
jgi:hypothetical protein